MRNLLTITLLFSAVGLSACGDESVSRAKVSAAGDNDIVSRNDAINTVALAVCERYDSCVGFSTQADYADMQSCENDQKSKWSGRWDDDTCVDAAHGPVAGKVRECASRAETSECSGNIFDLASEWTQCTSGNVCR